ncbi:MAG: circularly permuted type 2 ATP-grasp protein [Pseudomonadota bacterium]
MTAPAKRIPEALSTLLAGYNVPAQVADELLDADGAIRPVWLPFIEQFAKLGSEQIAAHFARGDQYLRDAGVFYRQYSAEPLQERAWPLSHVPVILHEQEWTTICDGLAQRAELLERVIADLYSEGRLVRDGHLPASLVARNTEWHRPLVGVPPVSGHYLHFLAFEIGRSPDGSWVVLGDRAQAPSGAGFALENRMATVRMYPDKFSRAHVHRLAGFFRAFRDAMDLLPGAEGRRTAILSPGPGNDTYFEHAYIARYLGLVLLEGEDLIVQNGEVFVRTVSGPQPVGVIWRRLDAAYADSLELNESSKIGTPGLVHALRHSSVSLVNALGSGIVETRAFMAFLPKIAEVVLGTPLKLPNVATWWCGQPSERAYVQSNADALYIGEALSRSLPFDIGAGAAIAGAFQGDQTHGRAEDAPDAQLRDWIDANGPDLVGQEAVTLSTTPAWIDGQLKPRPMTIRVFAARTPEGWTFLPGGYARIGKGGDATALSMQRGGSVADVWVMGDAPVGDRTMFESGSFRREDTGMLPSRAADNLLWLGRYVERCEGAIRLLRAYHLRLAETGDANDARLQSIARHFERISFDVSAPVETLLEPSLQATRLCAGRVRDRFSVDGWAALSDLLTNLSESAGTLAPGDDSARALGVLLRKITGFNGLVHENMHRTSGWRFLTFGRALERADGASMVLRSFAGEDRTQGLLDVALEYADSRITHQRRYRVDPTHDTVVDLIALDPDNPRAIRFQVTAMRRIAETLPFARRDGRVSAVLEALMPLETSLAVAHPEDVIPARLSEVRRALATVARRLAAAYLD